MSNIENIGTLLQIIIIFITIFLYLKINFFGNKAQKLIGIFIYSCREFGFLSIKKKIGTKVVLSGKICMFF